MKYLIGNWKSNYTIEEAQHWIEAVKKTLPDTHPDLTTVICPGFHHLLLFKLNLPGQTLGAQTISAFPPGTYTGQIAATNLRKLVEYVIVGHSERRTWAKESNSDVANQVTQALDNHITPIIAVDNDNWFSQLSILSSEELTASLIMYEPPEAISRPDGGVGSGEAAPKVEVVKAITAIKQEFSAKGFIYGGSVKSHNLSEFLSDPNIDGVLPGSASLKADEWVKMVLLANQVLVTGH